MSMVLIQARLPKKLVSEVNFFVNNGFYENKSDFIRDAVRKLVFEEQLRSVKLGKNSVVDVKKIRKELSNKKVNLKEINSLK
jgi:Arc/MetJ-type ribon-helix-helix transcriptional regulator